MFKLFLGLIKKIIFKISLILLTFFTVYILATRHFVCISVYLATQPKQKYLVFHESHEEKPQQ